MDRFSRVLVQLKRDLLVEDSSAIKVAAELGRRISQAQVRRVTASSVTSLAVVISISLYDLQLGISRRSVRILVQWAVITAELAQ